MFTSVFAKSYTIRLSPEDKFTVKVPDEWNLKKKEYVKNKSAILFADAKDSSFSLTMYFDRAGTMLNSEEKLKKAIIIMAEDVLPRVAEDSVTVKPMELEKSYGFYATFTDKKELDPSDPTQFKYMTRGFIRLSDDSVLGFMMLTHKLDDDLHKELMEYLAEFIK